MKNNQPDWSAEALLKAGGQALGQWIDTQVAQSGSSSASHSSAGATPSSVPKPTNAQPSAAAQHSQQAQTPLSGESSSTSTSGSEGNQAFGLTGAAPPLSRSREVAKERGGWGRQVVRVGGMLFAAGALCVAGTGLWTTYQDHKASPPMTRWFQSEDDVIRMSFQDKAVQQQEQAVREQIDACLLQGTCSWSPASGPEAVPQLHLSEHSIDCREPCTLEGDARVPQVHLQVRENGDIVEWATHNGVNVGSIEHPYQRPRNPAQDESASTVGWRFEPFTHP